MIEATTSPRRASTRRASTRRASTRRASTRRNSTSRRTSISGGGGGIGRRGSSSAQFLMFKDLECKEEFQKVRMAGFLRELHKLATDETKEKVQQSIVCDSINNKSNNDSAHTTTDGNISLRGISLLELTPAQAQSKLRQLRAGEKFDSDSLIRLTQAAIFILQEEDTVVDLRDRSNDNNDNKKLRKVTVVGDLHGSLISLQSVLELVDISTLKQQADDRVVVFDGDFVDRGEHSLEVIATLLLLKLSHPNNVFLLRGNHEDTMTASTYGFREEIEEKYPDNETTADEIWKELGLLFAAFPICARTHHAVIMHGGIPTEDLSLEAVNAISKETRCELITIADPYDDDERLIQGILWSDPADETGIAFSDRGAGSTFGPDITKDFLDRHDLKYIIRAHEPFEEGTNHDHDLGDGRGVVTIFSTANYPNGEGTNMGAILHLDEETGVYEIASFIHDDDDDDTSNPNNNYDTSTYLKSVVDGNKSKLAKAFREVQNAYGFVTCDQWADVVAEQLELPDVPWLELQPDLAPTQLNDAEMIDWQDFLTKFSTQFRIPKTELLQNDQLALLHEHKNKFLNIFQLLDTDGSGTISQEEFTSGIKMLNEQITGGQTNTGLNNTVDLFHVFDIDGDGEISIEEFCQALKNSATLKGLTDALDTNQVEALRENQDMLLLAFKYLDTDRSGAIDREEFQRGVGILNNRLPERSKLGDPQELFCLLDLDGDGEIDLNEFNHMFRSI